MPKPRTPTEVLERRGAFINHPERKGDRAGEPVPNGPVSRTAPSYLTVEEGEIWMEFIEKVPAGVLGDCDEEWLAETVRLAWKARNRCLTNGERLAYLNCLGKLGMNPSERSKVKVRTTEAPEDEWSELESPGQTM